MIVADSRLAFIQGRYDESLELDSNNVDVHQCAGNAYMSFGNYELKL